jgi:hypothetical protein
MVLVRKWDEYIEIYDEDFPKNLINAFFIIKGCSQKRQIFEKNRS